MSRKLEYCEVAENVYHIHDELNNFSTLVIGEEKALLFDTMMGQADLKACVRELTALPLIVVNSHCHLDHVGGNAQFEKVYCNSADWGLLEENLENTFARETSQKIELDLCRESLGRRDLLEDINEGSVFDLGGIQVEMVALPGHTKGSMGALVKERRLLLVGDAISPQMCLFLGGEATLDDYRATLQKAMQMDFDFFLTGHFEKLFPKEVLEEFAACAERPGKKRGFEYEYSLIPKYKGIFYLHQIQNPLVGDIICIIVRPDMVPQTETTKKL